MNEGRRQFDQVMERGSPAYDQAKLVAQGDDLAAKQDLALQTNLPPELLYYLAEDQNASVRRVVATNPTTPRQADGLLSRDADVEVRSNLAVKIAAFTPGLDRERRATVRDLTIEVLETLARDEIARVRATLANAIKDVKSAPAEVVTRVIEILARDIEASVATPVLEHSPLLSEDFLASVITNPQSVEILPPIARRAGLPEQLSDALVRTGDEEAIVSLLTNTSAQIREETLDQLIDAAPAKPSYHEPLVRRPNLSGDNATKLAHFVAIALVAELEQRPDLNNEAVARLSAELERRIEENPQAAAEAGLQTPAGEKDLAIQMYRSGELDAAALAEAIAAGRRAFVLMALTMMSGLAEPVVHSLLNSKNAKAIVSLGWKAGMEMELVVQLQARLGGIDAATVMKPTDNGDFPLGEGDMEWQIDLVAEAEAG